MDMMKYVCEGVKNVSMPIVSTHPQEKKDNNKDNEAKPFQDLVILPIHSTTFEGST